MLGQRLSRCPWERRFADLGSTRHIYRQLRRLTISLENDATDVSASDLSITAESGGRYKKKNQEPKVGKNRQRLSKVYSHKAIALF